MNKNPATTALLVILVVSALCSVAFCGLYVRDAVRLRDLQRSTANVQIYRNSMLALINDTLEYSKKNPSIDPILEAAGFKPKAGAPQTPKPGSK
jgi:Na+-transporting NADH:ubiquinone oxidoreductase subunit NqrC